MLNNFWQKKQHNKEKQKKKRKQIAHSLLNCFSTFATTATTVDMCVCSVGYLCCTCYNLQVATCCSAMNQFPRRQVCAHLQSRENQTKKNAWCNTKVKIKSHATSGGKALTTGRWHTTNLSYCKQLMYKLV